MCLRVRDAPSLTVPGGTSLPELPCIAEHQPYTKSASRGDVGQAANDAAVEREGAMADRWEAIRLKPEEQQRNQDGAD